MKCEKCKSENVKTVTKYWHDDRFIFIVCDDCDSVYNYDASRDGLIEIKKVGKK